SPLRELLRADTLALASGAFDLSVAGSDTSRTASIRASVRALVWNGLRLSSADLTSEGALDRSWHATGASATLALRLLHGLPVPVRDAFARARLEGRRLTFNAGASTDVRSSVRVVGSAAFDSLRTLVTLDSLAIRADTVSWQLAKRTNVEIARTRWSVDGLDLRSRSGRLSVRGGVDRRGEQDLDVTLHRVGFPGLGRWIGRQDLGGVLDGELALRGPAARPKADGQLQLALLLGGERAGSVGVRMAAADGRARVDGAFTSPRADSLAWSSQLPFTASLAIPEPSSGSKPPVAFTGP